MSPYCAMGNNPMSYADPNGDTPVHALAAVIGAGTNLYNNWSSVVKNPWSAVGYIATGAVAGAVSVGNPALGRAIAAGGNAVTDAASGNLPQLNGFSDIAEYGMKLTFDAIDVGGAGKLAKAGIKGLADLGSDWAREAMMSNPEQFGIIITDGVEGVIEVNSIHTIHATHTSAGQLYGGGASMLATGTVGFYTKSSMSNGRKMHEQYKINDVDKDAGRIKEYGKIKGIRPDFIDIPNKTVYELKPNNPRSIRRGKKQLERYAKKLSKKFGGKWKKVLDLY